MYEITKTMIKQALQEKVITKREAEELLRARTRGVKKLERRQKAVGSIQR